MKPQDNKMKFIICHAIFLLSFIAAYYIPVISSIINDTNLPPLNRYLRFYMIGLFSVMFAFYYLYLYYYNRSDASLFKLNKLSLYLFSATIAVFLFLCSSHTLLSGDLFEYSLRGRMLGLYGLNPYMHIAAEIRQDMFFPLIFWKNMPEYYGPLWVIIGTLHTLFFKNSMGLTIFMHKFILFLFLILTTGVFYKLCIELKFKRPDVLTAAFFTNPLIIIMTFMDGHNEIVMTFFILVAFYLLIRSKYIFSLLVFALSTQVKFIYLFILPLFILYILFRDNGRSLAYRFYTIIIGAICSVAAIALLWFPFGKEGFINVFNYYFRNLRMNFEAGSIPYAAHFILGKIGIIMSEHAMNSIFTGIFFITYACLIYYFIIRVKTDKKIIFSVSSFMILALIYTNSSPFNPWYSLWVIPLILLSQLRSKFLLALLLSYFSLIVFWKRMSVLSVPMIGIYFIMLVIYNRYSQRLRFIFSLEGK